MLEFYLARAVSDLAVHCSDPASLNHPSEDKKPSYEVTIEIIILRETQGYHVLVNQLWYRKR